jgi:ribosomal protein S27AE
MRLPHLPSGVTRFWAKPLAFYMECPRCGTVIYAQTTRRSSPAGSPRGEPTKDQRGWDPKTGRLKCPNCGLVVVVGLIAWPTLPKGGVPRTAPQDQVPGERENAQLRAMGGEGAGWWMPKEKAIKAFRPEHTNITAKCTCRYITPYDKRLKEFWEVDPNCAIHAEPDARETVNEDRWPR